MFAEIISVFTSLFLVLLFIFLLHFYTRCFLARDREIRDETQTPVIPFVFGARLYRHRNFATNDEQNTSPPIKGLGSSIISSIPKFVFVERIGHGLECVICLSSFKDEEVGRKLTLCDHAFHVECIDMWLYSHRTCPICRTPAVKLSVYGEIVVDSSPEDEINGNEQILREFSGTISNLDEVRGMNNEGSSRLEIIVEIPYREIEMNCAVHGKLHSSSGACP